LTCCSRIPGGRVSIRIEIESQSLSIIASLDGEDATVRDGFTASNSRCTARLADFVELALADGDAELALS
jgi:hypothetical protein